MTAGKFVAYYRVSTAKQGASGLGLEAQQASVRSFLNGMQPIEEVIEVESGKNSDRPKLAHALALCRIHNATLIIAKLDRLARSVAFVSRLMESGVEFKAVDFPTASKVMVHILVAIAEHEAAMVSQRTKAALAAAKARGVVLGGDRGNITRESAKGREASIKARKATAARKASDLLPVIRAIESEGATSLRQIAAVLNKRGIPTARGGMWSAVQVQRITALTIAQ